MKMALIKLDYEPHCCRCCPCFIEDEYTTACKANIKDDGYLILDEEMINSDKADKAWCRLVIAPDPLDHFKPESTYTWENLWRDGWNAYHKKLMWKDFEAAKKKAAGITENRKIHALQPQGSSDDEWFDREENDE